MHFWARLVLGILATWRVTHLFANEDGPWELIARFRVRLGSGSTGQLMDCFNCLSVWVAMPMALCVTRRPREFAPTWLALSGAACLIERFAQEPAIIQLAPEQEQGSNPDGMLRTETSDAQKRFAARKSKDASR
jgi:Protein of unknown function (DUF1360)